MSKRCKKLKCLGGNRVKVKKYEKKDRKMATTSNSKNGMKKGGKKVKMVATGTPELKAEPVGTPETRGVTTFGFDAKELLTRLQNESEFAETFMEEYAVLQDIVKQFKEHQKALKDAERQQVQKEKDEAERARLKEVISKIKEKDPEVVLEPETDNADFFEESSIKYLKQWVKNYRADVKAQKEAAKAQKLAEKEAKAALKAEKAAAKAEKEAAQREKFLEQIPKFVEGLDYVPEYDADTIELAELKVLHARCKMLNHLQKFAENVVNMPEYEDETIEDEDLKALHARCKLLNQLQKLDVMVDYDNEKDNDALKALIQETKDAATN